ncbi:MAG: type II toxin-antitoxin system death-on-curing family toxin [Isosphaerales bacterium]
MKYLTALQMVRIHTRSIEQSGGDAGVRDLAMLESAVAQPRASFRGEDLYRELAEKAAALAFSLVMNHPFTDGNKRTGYGAMMMFLSRNGHTVAAPLDEHASVFLRLAAGELDRDGFLAWVRAWIARK